MPQLGDIEEFVPVWWARGRHRQTILAHMLNRSSPPPNERQQKIVLEDGNQLVALENRPQNGGAIRGVVLLMHGLGGDAGSPYMLSAARRFLERDWSVFRLNHRGAGAGAGLSSRLYNCGLSDDIHAVLEAIAALHPEKPLWAVGYSMSGNTLLKYVGERGADAAGLLKGAVAVNAPLSVGLSIDTIAHRGNGIYNRRFTRLLQEQFTKNTADAAPKYRSIREFDEQVTAPAWGFTDADDYYHRSSSLHQIQGILTPTIILTSDDDPIVPAWQFREAAWPDSVTVHITRGGGHLGYLGRQTPLGDRRWLDYAVLIAAESFIG